ncbi:hypothetical protein HY991_01995 [Candidatus Micrarchaeota archaeon]|nr:hypothetical protein [Candidatus Micrarchaeota archaeon]
MEGSDSKEGFSKIYAGFAIIGLLFIMLAGYVFFELNAINARLEKNPSGISGMVTALEQRLTALEGGSPTTVTPNVTVKMKLYYMLSDPLQTEVLKNLPGLNENLKKQGIVIELEDVGEKIQELKGAGFKSLPVIFLSEAEAEKSEQLKSQTDTMQKVKGGYAIDAYGFLTNTKVLLSDGCKNKDYATLYFFYSESCPYCKQAEPNVEKVGKDFGTMLSVENVCIKIHEGDDKLCTDKYGAANYTRFDNLREQYTISGTPTYVLDCKYVFGGISYDQIKAQICSARADLCNKLPKSLNTTQ